MHDAMEEVMQYIEENDVKFIRLAFCNIFGIQKNISIMPDELPRAFAYGISFDAAVLPGFTNLEESDLLLFPDPSTLSVLPWRPSQGRVIRLFCDIKYPDGKPFEGDGRCLLKQAVKRAKDMQLSCAFGTECEFYLFEQDAKGNPTRNPQDQASYCDIAPLDRGENVRRQICLTLEEMGIQPESSHHEFGPGQNEIDFKYSSALQAADNFITFKSVVKTMAAANGLFASFLPKPLAGKSGSGLHIHMSLFQNGKNMFETDQCLHNATCAAFIAGILQRAADMTIFLNPLTNSYTRFGEFEAPKYISWSHQNRSPLIRIPSATGEYSRMELRSPDSCANPYLAFTLLIHAGLDGIVQNTALPLPCNENLFTAPASILRQYDVLPESLGAALKAAQQSDFITRNIPARILRSYFHDKELEWNTYLSASDKQESDITMYFQHY